MTGLPDPPEELLDSIVKGFMFMEPFLGIFQSTPAKQHPDMESEPIIRIIELEKIGVKIIEQVPWRGEGIKMRNLREKARPLTFWEPVCVPEHKLLEEGINLKGWLVNIVDRLSLGKIEGENMKISGK